MFLKLRLARAISFVARLDRATTTERKPTSQAKRPLLVPLGGCPRCWCEMEPTPVHHRAGNIACSGLCSAGPMVDPPSAGLKVLLLQYS
jgi:hypothetical protein